MNIRTTIVLVIILIAVITGSALYIKSRSGEPPSKVSPRRDFFYLVDDDAIKRVQVNYQGQGASYVTDADGKWHFNTPDGEPVNMERWGGVTLLLSGPQYKRIITEKAADLARYGLANPPTVINVGLKEIGDVQIKIGDKTPDGGGHYAQFKSNTAKDNPEAVYLVDSSWGDVLSRLVTEPPRITPTPAPGAPTAQPSGTPGPGSPTPQAGVTATPQGGPSPTPAAAKA